MRRRLDRQERVREALLLDLGAIVFELHRQERREPELLEAKAAELERVDDEARVLAVALGEGHALPQLTARGLVAACTACGAIMGVRDRHCPSCGASAGAPATLDEVEGDELEEPPPLEEPSYDEEIEVHVGEPASVAASRADSNGGGVAPWFAEQSRPPSPHTPPPADGREPLVPRAQRTLRAGRRLARTWIEERRSGGR